MWEGLGVGGEGLRAMGLQSLYDRHGDPLSFILYGGSIPPGVTIILLSILP